MDTDVIVIGGGCNGTGLARDLAKRGLQVVLCEKGDFARGATGASSGMIHGGPRYLLNDVETTRHSCEDSGYIQRIVPHILFRVPFLVPVFANGAFGPLGMVLHDVYFGVYDRYSALKNGIPHARLTVEQMLALEPGLRGDFLGGVTLDEWGIDPGRLCVLNAEDARLHGAEIRTYTEVVGFLRDADGAVTGVKVRAAVQGSVQALRAKVVVNCGGPWAEKLAHGAGGGRAFAARQRRAPHLREAHDQLCGHPRCRRWPSDLHHAVSKRDLERHHGRRLLRRSRLIFRHGSLWLRRSC